MPRDNARHPHKITALFALPGRVFCGKLKDWFRKYEQIRTRVPCLTQAYCFASDGVLFM